MTNPADSRPFQGTVAFYERYRLAYPERLIARVATLAGLQPGDAVLDLGCGTGMLAIPFAQAGMTVTAMDPEPEMLAATQAGALAAGVPVKTLLGGSQDLTAEAGPYRLVVIGRAFHWMEQAATLAMLDRIVTPDGGVALFHDAHPPVAENAWFAEVARIGKRFDRQAAAQAGGQPRGGHSRYEPFLLASAFTQLDGLSVTIRHALTLDEILGRALSMSSASPGRLGVRKDDFVAQLSSALLDLSPDGKFAEVAELVALLARRP